MKQSDRDIIELILRGGEHGYSILLQRYRARVFSLALRIIGSREEAEEAAQDAFIRAFRALPGFEQRARFSTWLYRITYNTALNYATKKRDPAEPMPEDHDEADEGQLPADAKLEHDDLKQQVHLALERLRPEYSAILTLFYLEDQGYEEIAEITGLPLGTVKNRLHRARKELRNFIVRNYTYLASTA